VSFEVFAEAYLAYSRREHTPSTARTRRDLVRGKLVPFFGATMLEAIRPRDVDRLLMTEAARSPGTRNRVLSALSALFERAIALGYVRHNPARACRRAREHAAPLPLVSIAEQRRLIGALPEAMRPFFLTALDTGARRGELLALRWADVDLETRSLLVRRSKSGRPRIVRLSKRAAKALGDAKPDTVAGGALVFADAVAGYGDLRWRWRRAFKEAAAAIGHPALRVHDLRHLAAINLVRAGLDLPSVQAHLGHKHLISTLRYAAYADATASARAARLQDDLFGEPDEDAPERASEAPDADPPSESDRVDPDR
jgi:integrase